MSCLKNATKTGLMLLQRIDEQKHPRDDELSVQSQKNAMKDAEMKGLVDEAIQIEEENEQRAKAQVLRREAAEEESEEEADQEADQEEEEEEEEEAEDAEEVEGEEAQEAAEGEGAVAHSKQEARSSSRSPASPSFVSMFNTLEATEESTVSTSHNSPFAVHSAALTSVPPYHMGSPIFVGEVATGLYSQQSAVPNRSGFVFHDMGGVARNAYEVFLRLSPKNRPLLVGAIGNDEGGRRIRDFHGKMGDSLEGVKTMNGSSLEIWGFYDKSGYPEREYRSYCDAKITVSQLTELGESFERASSVFVDTSLSIEAQRRVAALLKDRPSRLLVSPCDSSQLRSLLESSLLQRTDYLCISVEELWDMACLVKPELRSQSNDWKQRSRIAMRFESRLENGGVFGSDSSLERAAERGSERNAEPSGR